MLNISIAQLLCLLFDYYLQHIPDTFIPDCTEYEYWYPLFNDVLQTENTTKVWL